MIRYRVKANYTLINGEQLSNSATYYSENTALNNADNTFTYQGLLAQRAVITIV